MSCYIKRVNLIDTYNQQGQQNGYLLTLVNLFDPPDEAPIEQVYITCCAPKDIKGPHLHRPPKTDRFYCIEGRCVVVCRDEATQVYQEFVLSAFDEQLLIIPPNNSHAFVALGYTPAMILSIPTEGYHPGKPYNQLETEYQDYDWTKWTNQ